MFHVYAQEEYPSGCQLLDRGLQAVGYIARLWRVRLKEDVAQFVDVVAAYCRMCCDHQWNAAFCLCPRFAAHEGLLSGEVRREFEKGASEEAQLKLK